MAVSVRIVLICSILVIRCLICGAQTSQRINLPGDEPFYSGKSDTVYEKYYELKDGIETPVRYLSRINKGLVLYDYYPSGNIWAIRGLVKGKEKEITDTLGKTSKEQEYDLNGPATFYYDSSVRLLLAKGIYGESDESDTWFYFYKNGKLMEKAYSIPLCLRSEYFDTLGRDTEQIDRIITFDGQVNIVRDVEFHNGKTDVFVDDSLLLKIIIRYGVPLSIFIFLAFFARVFLNHLLFKRELGIDKPLIYYPGMKGNYSEAILHGFECSWTLFWTKVKPENRGLAKAENSLSVIVILFVVFIIAAEVTSK